MSSIQVVIPVLSSPQPPLLQSWFTGSLISTILHTDVWYFLHVLEVSISKHIPIHQIVCHYAIFNTSHTMKAWVTTTRPNQCEIHNFQMGTTMRDNAAWLHTKGHFKEKSPSCLGVHAWMHSNFGLDWICLTTTHVLQDILAVLHM